MICPTCVVQMTQHEQIGGGEANDREYTTWEVKKCPSCGRLVKESYSAEVLSDSEVEKLRGETDIIIGEEDEI